MLILWEKWSLQRELPALSCSHMLSVVKCDEYIYSAFEGCANEIKK